MIRHGLTGRLVLEVQLNLFPTAAKRKASVLAKLKMKPWRSGVRAEKNMPSTGIKPLSGDSNVPRC